MPKQSLSLHAGGEKTHQEQIKIESIRREQGIQEQTDLSPEKKSSLIEAIRKARKKYIGETKHNLY